MAAKPSAFGGDGVVADWVEMHEALRARFLRRLSKAIDTLLLRQLDGPGAEVAGYSSFLAQRMASEDDVIPALGAALNAALDAESARAIAGIAALGDKEEAARLQHSLDQSRAPGVRSADRARALRGILGFAARRLGGETDQASQDRAASIAALDHRWCDARDDALSAIVPPAPVDAPDTVEVSADRLTEYLIKKFPQDPDIRCTEFRLLPGGRSKRTIILEIEGSTSLPQQMVMRQDGTAGIDTSVVDEARALASAAGHRLPIPEVLLCEDRTATLGKPFMLMNRLPGVQAGSYFSFSPPDRPLAIKAAGLLAGLHRIDPAGTPLARNASPGAKATILKELGYQEAKWRAETVEPSPIMEYALHWVRNNLDRVPDAWSIIHGDYRPHNFLVDQGEITGLLDWEFTHIGDPAEDLAYIRPTIIQFMPWDDFMAAYVAAGGAAHDEGTLLFYEVWNMVRLTASGVAGTGRFLQGKTDDICDGIGGYFILPVHESLISRSMRAAEQAWPLDVASQTPAMADGQHAKALP